MKVWGGLEIVFVECLIYWGVFNGYLVKGVWVYVVFIIFILNLLGILGNRGLVFRSSGGNSYWCNWILANVMEWEECDGILENSDLIL